MTTVLVVTGSRAWPEKHSMLLTDRIWSTYKAEKVDRLLVGDCPHPRDRSGAMSVDAVVAGIYARLAEVVPALWDHHGRTAGPIRNTEIARRAKYYLDGGCRVIALAFPLDGGPKGGTWDCVRKLQRIGVEPEIVRVPK